MALGETDNAGDASRTFELRKRILLIALALLTIAVMLGTTEFLAGHFFRASRTNVNDCIVLDDPSTGLRGIPNTVCFGKVAEANSLVEYRFNNCGHRAAMQCGPKAPGTYRIVMTGSSVAMGMETAFDDTFAATLPALLSQRTGRKVELYNEGMESGFPRSVELRFDDVLAAHPDMILWVLTPFDVKKVSSLLMDERPQGSFLVKNWARLKASLATESLADAFTELWQRVTDAFGRTHTAFMLRHFLFESQTQYVRSYLLGNDDESGFLRSEPSKLWQDRIQEFDGYATRIEQRATAAGVPLVAVLLPNRAQAAILSMGEWPVGIDPYRLSEELRRVIVAHGGSYVDILQDFREIPNPERGYLPVDGHPNARGHAVFSALLAKKLADVVRPATTMSSAASRADISQ